MKAKQFLAAGLMVLVLMLLPFGAGFLADDEPEPPPVGNDLPCVAPHYCTTDECGCEAEGAQNCECNNDCGCKDPANVGTPCETPGRCTTDACKCEDGAEYCICGPGCLCRLPDFTITADTYVNKVASASVKSGDVATVTVNTTMMGTDVNFDSVVFKTYVPKSLTVPELDIENHQFTSVTKTVEGEYTVITIECNTTGTMAAEYDFDLYFPTGITENATSEEIWTKVECTVVKPLPDGGDVRWDLQDEAYKDLPLQSIGTATLTAEAETTWTTTISNAELDYKDPNEYIDPALEPDNIFRVQVDLQRTPAGENGVYYLHRDSLLTVSLPCGGDASNVKNVLRVTDGNGNNVAYDLDAQGNLTLKAGDIPALNGRSGDYITNASGRLYVVFELDEDYLEARSTDVVETPDGTFYLNNDLQVKAEFDYTLTYGSGSAEDDEPLGIVTYVPGDGGEGSLGKSAQSPYVDGESFYRAGGAPEATPIEYTLAYTNRSNAPVTDLVISDEKPRTKTILPDGTLGDAGVDGVYFYQFALTHFDLSYVEGGVFPLIELIPVIGGMDQTPIVIAQSDINDAGSTWFTFASDVDSFRLEVGGELRHGFSLRAKLTVLGDPDLYEPANADERNKINFVVNTARFTATPTKGVNPTPKGGSDEAWVHVYPFENAEPPSKVWTLSAGVSGTTSGYGASVTATRGRNVYFRINVRPEDANQHVYNPVFYLELPPGIQFDASDPDAVTFYDSANTSLAWEVIDNPTGPGKMLKIYNDTPAAKVLLSPLNSGTIVVKATLDKDTPTGSSITCNAYFGVQDPKTSLDKSHYENTPGANSFIDTTTRPSTEDFKESAGDVALPLLLTTAVQVNARTSGLLEGELWVQTEKDRASAYWHRHPEVAEALPGGFLTYKYVVRNGGDKTAQDVVLYSIFSHEGDKFVVGNRERNSVWQPYLVGPIDVTGSSVGVTIYYSEYDDHRLDARGNVIAGTDDWTTTPYRYSDIKAIKIVLEEDLDGGETFTLEVPMYAPVDFDVEAYLLANSGLSPLAITTMATSFQFENSIPTALEPLQVGVKLVKNEKGEIAGTVWSDSVEDGDMALDGQGEFEDGEYALGNVRLLLYPHSDPTNPIEAFTDPYGQYRFTNLEEGGYTLRVVLADAAAGYRGSAHGGAGLDNQIYTSGNLPGSGEPCVEADITISFSATPEDKVQEGWHCGLYALPVTISGTVWRSLAEGTGGTLTGSCERDILTAGRDTPLNGVTVTLWQLLGQGQRKEVTTCETGSGGLADGAYEFLVPPGRYVVVFTELTNHSIVDPRWALPDGTPAGIAGNTAGDGLADFANYSQAQPEEGANTTNLVHGQSYEIWLAPATPQAGISCGMLPKTGSIAGNVWRDTNGNGAQSSGENGIGSCGVSLYKMTDYGAKGDTEAFATTSTDSNGNYSFAGLTPGSYKVVYNDTAQVEYVSYCGDATPTTAIAEANRTHTASYASLEIRPQGGDTKLNYTAKNFGLVRKITLSGRVFNDRKGADGVWTDSSADTALGTVTDGVVIARASGAGGDGTVVNTTATASTTDGSYSISLWPGSYTVAFPAGSVPGTDANSLAYDSDYLVTTKNEGGFSRGTRTWTLNNLTSGTSKANVSLALTRPRSLQGLVWHDEDGSGGAKDSGESTLVRPTIVLKQGGAVVPGAGYSLTDVDSYHFQTLYPGTYTVHVPLADAPKAAYLLSNAFSVSTSNRLQATAGEAVYTITIPADDTGAADDDPHDKDIGLAKPVSISGQIWHDKDINASSYLTDGVYDSSAGKDTPLASLAEVAWLYRYEPANPDADSDGYVLLKKGDTNSGGAYTFDTLLPGGYKVELHPAASTYYVAGPGATPGPATTAVSNPTATKGNAAYGYAASDGAETATWSGIVLLSNQTTPEAIAGLDLPLGKYATISGLLWHDLNGDGQMQSATESKLSTTERLYLQRRNAADTAWEDVEFKDTSTGEYTFKVKPGKYQVILKQGARRVTNENTDFAVDEQSDPVTLRTAVWTVTYSDAGTILYAGKNYLFSIYASISGNVWVDKNANATWDTTPTAELAKTGAIVTLNYVSGPYGPAAGSWWDNYTGPKTAEIDADGDYLFEQLWPGNYTVTVSNGVNGYVLTNLVLNDDVSAGTGLQWAIELKSSAGQENVNFGLIKPSSFSGDVWRDANNNATKDAPGESSITGANVKITLTRTGETTQMNAISVTELNTATGFTLQGLLPGSYDMTIAGVDTAWLRTFATAVDGLSVSGGSGSTATITPVAGDERKYTVVITDSTGDGVAVSNAMVGFAAPSTIAGVVFADNNNNEIQQGEDEVSLASLSTPVTVGVQLQRRNVVDTGWDNVTSQNNGAAGFSFGDLLPGKYRLIFSGIDSTWLTTTLEKTMSSGYTTVGTAFAHDDFIWTVDIKTDNQTGISLPTGVVKAGSIAGYVWRDVNADAAKAGAAETFYEGLTLSLKKSDWSAPITLQSGDDTGAFSFTNLYPGSYTLTLTRPDSTWYVTTTGTNVLANGNDFVIPLTAGQTVGGKNYGLTQLVTLKGRVWLDNDAGGANGEWNSGTDTPAAMDTALVLTGTDGRSQTVNRNITTTTGGEYTVAGLVPGSYTVQLATTSYADYVLTNSFTDTTAVQLNAAARKWVVTAPSGHTQSDINFALSNLSVIRGNVWHDLNANGEKQGTGEAGTNANITVTLEKKQDGVEVYDPVQTLSVDSDGDFVYAGAVIGTYRIKIVMATGWGVTTAHTNHYITVPVTALGRTEEVSIGISQYITLNGLVWQDVNGDALSAGESGITGHGFTLYRNNVEVTGPFTTGTDGVLSITPADKIFAGNFTLQYAAKSTDLVTNRAEAFAHSTRTWTFTLASGGTQNGLNCGFTAPRSITGTVWHDLDANGTKDTGEDFIAGITVQLYRQDASGEFVAMDGVSQVLGVDGQFTFGNLYPGVYQAWVMDTNGEYLRTNPAVGQTQQSLYLAYTFSTTDTEPADKTIGLAKPVNISGLAFLDTDSDGAYTANVDRGTAVSLEIQRNGSTVATAPVSTNADGSFSLAGLRLLPGEYTLVFGTVAEHAVSTPDAPPAFDATQRTWTLTLNSGEVRSDVEIGYQYTQYKLTGFVWMDGNGNDACETDESCCTILNDVQVTIEHVASGTTYGPVQVDNDGKFEVCVDAPGEYRVSGGCFCGDHLVTARRPEYDRASNQFAMALSYDLPQRHLEVGLAKHAVIEGMLWTDLNGDGVQQGAGETPLGNWRIRLVDENGHVEAETVTAADGSYHFASVRPGNYTVQLANSPVVTAFFTGYHGAGAMPAAISTFNARTGVWTLSVAEGAALSNVSSGYHAPSTIEGVLVDESTGKPLADHAVELYRKNAQDAYELWDSASTDGNGAYSFGQLLPGDYLLRVVIPDGYSVSKDSTEGTLQGNVVEMELNIPGMNAVFKAQTKVTPPAMTEDPPPGKEDDENPSGQNPEEDLGQQTGAGHSVETSDDTPLLKLQLLGLAMVAAIVLMALLRRRLAGYGKGRAIWRKTRR